MQVDLIITPLGEHVKVAAAGDGSINTLSNHGLSKLSVILSNTLERVVHASRLSLSKLHRHVIVVITNEGSKLTIILIISALPHLRLILVPLAH